MGKKLQVWIEAAMMAGLAMALSYVPDFAGWMTPSFGTLPILIFALRRGTGPGIIAGFLWGLLHFPLGKVYFLSVPQVLIEYILAFASAGLAGLVTPWFQAALARGQKKASWMAMISAMFFGVLAKYFWHFLAGVIFWGAYAEDGLTPFLYSLKVNGIACIATLVFVWLAGGAFLSQKSLFQVSNK